MLSLKNYRYSLCVSLVHFYLLLLFAIALLLLGVFVLSPGLLPFLSSRREYVESADAANVALHRDRYYYYYIMLIEARADARAEETRRHACSPRHRVDHDSTVRRLDSRIVLSVINHNAGGGGIAVNFHCRPRDRFDCADYAGKFFFFFSPLRPRSGERERRRRESRGGLVRTLMRSVTHTHTHIYTGSMVPRTIGEMES